MNDRIEKRIELKAPISRVWQLAHCLCSPSLVSTKSPATFVLKPSAGTRAVGLNR